MFDTVNDCSLPSFPPSLLCDDVKTADITPRSFLCGDEERIPLPKE